jgi:hypothetical protein
MQALDRHRLRAGYFDRYLGRNLRREPLDEDESRDQRYQLS